VQQAQWLKEITSYRKAQNDSSEKIREYMVMKEMPKPRQAYILERGLYDSHGEKFFQILPKAFYHLKKNLLKIALAWRIGWWTTSIRLRHE
jgi:hypothetical protein